MATIKYLDKASGQWKDPKRISVRDNETWTNSATISVRNQEAWSATPAFIPPDAPTALQIKPGTTNELTQNTLQFTPAPTGGAVHHYEVEQIQYADDKTTIAWGPGITTHGNPDSAVITNIIAEKRNFQYRVRAIGKDAAATPSAWSAPYRYRVGSGAIYGNYQVWGWGGVNWGVTHWPTDSPFLNWGGIGGAHPAWWATSGESVPGSGYNGSGWGWILHAQYAHRASNIITGYGGIPFAYQSPWGAGEPMPFLYMKPPGLVRISSMQMGHTGITGWKTISAGGWNTFPIWCSGRQTYRIIHRRSDGSHVGQMASDTTVDLQNTASNGAEQFTSGWSGGIAMNPGGNGVWDVNGSNGEDIAVVLTEMTTTNLNEENYILPWCIGNIQFIYVGWQNWEFKYWEQRMDVAPVAGSTW